MGMLAEYLSLPRTVHILCLGTLINRAGTFVMLFLAIYLQERLQLGGLFATRAIGVFGLGTLLAALVGGHLADTIGRKTVILLSLFGGASVLTVFGSIRNPTAILGAVLLFAFLAEMYRPAVSAMISDVVEVERRPHAYGLMYIAINVGAAIAPFVGGMLATHAFEYLFWGDAATSAAYALIIALSVPETLRRPTRDSNQPHDAEAAPSARAALRHILGDAVFIRFCLGTLFLSFVFMQSMSTFPLYLGHLSIGPDVYGRIIAVNGLLVVLFQVPMTHLVSQFNRANVIVLAALVTGIGFGLNGLASTPTVFAVIVVVWTAGELMQAPLVPTIVSDLSPPALRARYFGLVSMCFSGGNLIAAPIGGWVLVRYGSNWLWGGCILTALCSAVFYLSIHRRLTPHRTHERGGSDL